MSDTKEFPVPIEIAREVVRQQTKMGWPEMVPAYAAWPDASGQMVWDHFTNLTVGICEQLVEYHTRRGIKAIARWLDTFSPSSCRTAAKHILYARLYRCRYISLIGQTDSTEADMPFAIR